MPGQSIPTQYKGLEYRSREEARWAILFDALGIRVKYEPEGYLLDGGYMYLPDFRVDNLKLWGNLNRDIEDKSLYVEVKPAHDRLNPDKLTAFYKAGHYLYICDEIPENFYLPTRSVNPDTDHFYHSQWLINKQLNKVIFCIDNKGLPCLMDPHTAFYGGCDHEATARAYLRAHNAGRELPLDPCNQPIFGARPYEPADPSKVIKCVNSKTA